MEYRQILEHFGHTTSVRAKIKNLLPIILVIQKSTFIQKCNPIFAAYILYSWKKNPVNFFFEKKAQKQGETVLLFYT